MILLSMFEEAIFTCNPKLVTRGIVQAYETFVLAGSETYSIHGGTMCTIDGEYWPPKF